MFVPTTPFLARDLVMFDSAQKDKVWHPWTYTTYSGDDGADTYTTISCEL